MPQYFANGKVKSISKKENNTTIIISTCILCKKKLLKQKFKLYIQKEGLNLAGFTIYLQYLFYCLQILVLSQQQGQILDKEIYFEFIYMNIQS